MGSPLIEIVPNFSNGVDEKVLQYIAEPALAVKGVSLLDRHSDADHNRTVFTIAGSPQPVWEVAIAMVGRAAERIDLRVHRGVHPRLGACDVLPFVPVSGVTLDECRALAHSAGQEVWRRFGVPVYFYEAAALSPQRVNLEDVRRGGFESPLGDPDVGEGTHPSAGATAIGARKFLIAYNINLDTDDVSAAREIARTIRTSSGGLPNVKALGLFLESRRLAQVSMNLTDYEVTSIDRVFKTVAAEAALREIEIASSELIGLLPRSAVPRMDVRWENFDENKILENRLDAAIQSE